MKRRKHANVPRQHGVGLVEVLVSVIIAMLLVLVIYQIYEVSENQKRTITAGSDAQQNAAYGLHVLAHDLAIAGNGIASSASAMQACSFDAAAPQQSLAPIPVLITAGATANDPDTVAVFYGASATLSTPVQFKTTAAPGDAYVVPGPVGFSADADPKRTDVIVAVQGANCTLSTINDGGVAVDPLTGYATLTHTPVVGSLGATYTAVTASLVNLGAARSMGRVIYTVDPRTRALRTQKTLPQMDPVNPVVGDVINLKAQYGLDTTADGIIDTWQDATGAWAPTGLAALTPAQRLAAVRQILAVRLAIVTRSAKWEFDPATHQCLPVTPGPLQMFDGTVSMTLSADDKCYRYKILETIVPIRNALWNPQ
jgi:type IV pilus assembly protein PilW